MSDQHSWRGIVAIILACFLWGTTGTAASLTPDVSSLATGAFSMGVGGLLMALLSLKNLMKDRVRLQRCWSYLLLGGLAVMIYPLAFYSAMRLSGVAVGTVISIASAPFFTVLLERLVSKKTVSMRWVISFIIGSMGILLLTFDKTLSASAESSTDSQSLRYFLGVLLGLLAGLTYASYSWAAKCMIERQVSSRAAMAGMFSVAATVLIPSLWLTGDNLFSSTLNTSVAVYLAVVPMFIGYLLFGFGLKFVAASEATLLTLLEPVVATVMAVLIVGEQVGISGWSGMALILLCLLMQIKTHERQGEPGVPES